MSLLPKALVLAVLMHGGTALATLQVHDDVGTVRAVEDFDGGTDFTRGWVDVPGTIDDHLWVRPQTVSSMAFTGLPEARTLRLRFHYAASPGTDAARPAGRFSFGPAGGPVLLSGVLFDEGPGSPEAREAFARARPVPASGARTHDRLLVDGPYPAGHYVLTFHGGADGGSVKVDDVEVTAEEASSPGAVLVWLLGLGLVGWVALRSRWRRR